MSAELSYTCSVRQGFNFEKDAQDTVGFVTAMTVSGQKLKADITVTDPLKIDSGKISVVGVLSRTTWQGGYADPLALVMQVSAANKDVISSLVHQKLSNTKVNIQFVVYQFDQEAKEAQYFKAFHSNEKDLECLIEKGPASSSSSSAPLVIAIATDPDGVVQSPRNYGFSLCAVPQDKAQELHFAIGLGKAMVKRFGIEVKA